MLFLPLFFLFIQSVKAQDTLIVLFEHDQWEVPEDYLSEIKEMAELLLNSHNKILYIRGFTDHTGTEDYNFRLSQQRAAAVNELLIKNGVPPKLIEKIEGKGEIANNLPNHLRVPEDRRVELVVAPRSQLRQFSDVDVDSLEAGDQLVLDHLYFQPGRHFLVEESIPHLKELVLILRKHPNLKIELQGHVCCAPKGRDGLDRDTKTFDLSENRAHNIYEYLVENGIDSSRLSHRGFARTRPVYPRENNEAQKQANRRVEIKVLSNE